ncbi:hypothetical protein VII00023_04252 [Vibrio ichthyoenteri ATCC 700023]|uniref:Metal-binding protein n=1 Tax=Vibrio ichthyoenteri ATCC 700023 TaxID=870968 RepID=F9S510_9VIBR|nr:YecH family metal-binding protein [Vibrio ichthyoenteri]EGU36184.1 hypothetical protein VII00023_04252 [Vibrio ichthyoenteri ATCC 700023]
MANEIHAHKVLNLLREKPMTKQELNDAVRDQFGEQAQFRTCKLAGFQFDTLFDFFVQREKIIETEGLWAVNVERVCGH